MDVKSFTTIDGDKTGVHSSSTVEPWFEDKLPGNGKADNSFSTLYNSTLSCDDESELSKNKSWFDMVEEDEADVDDHSLDSAVKTEEKQRTLGESCTMLDIKIKEEVIDEDEYHNGDLNGHCFNAEAVITHEDLPVVIKQEKVCDITYTGVVTKQNKCEIVVKQEKNSEKSIALCAVPQKRIKVETIGVEKKTESVILKQKTDLVNSPKADFNDQMLRKVKDLSDKDLKTDQPACSVTFKQEKSPVASKSYANVAAKHGISNHVIVIKQETSPEKTNQGKSCIETSSEKNVNLDAKREHKHEEKTFKQETKSGSATLKRERNSANTQKRESNYQGKKKMKHETCIDDFINIHLDKPMKQTQDDDNKEYNKDKKNTAGEFQSNEEAYNQQRKRSLGSSSESINFKRDRSGSNSSGSAKNIHNKVEYERDPEVLARRQKQIDYGKNTLGYDNYRQQIPKETRTKFHPRTPPKHIKYSRRGWDGMVRIWRQQLHGWDPDSENGEAGLNDTASEVSVGTGSFTSDDYSDSLPTEQNLSGRLDDRPLHSYNDVDYEYLNLDHDELHELLD